MTKRCLVLLSIIELLAVGCHQSPYMHAHMELVNAEKRALEDQLYSLEFDYEDALREIEKLKQQNNRLHGPSDIPDRDNSSLGPRSQSSSRSKGSRDSLAPPVVDEGMLTEPKIELAPESKAPESRTQDLPLPKSNTAPRTRPLTPPTPPGMPPRTSVKPSGQKTPVDVEVPTRILTLDPADPRVTHVFLNPLLTGGKDFDKQPGDDGVVVVVEPRNRDDVFVPLAGPISVLVLDPAKSADQGRILARWEIDASEAQRALVNSPTVRGIQLRLPWPATAPQASRLELHVRYLTVDHRELRADRELFITLPGQFSQRWTPRAAVRRQSNDAPSTTVTPQTADSAPTNETELTAQAQPTGPKTDFKKPTAAPAPSNPSQTARPEWRPYR